MSTNSDALYLGFDLSTQQLKGTHYVTPARGTIHVKSLTISSNCYQLRSKGAL